MLGWVVGYMFRPHVKKAFAATWRASLPLTLRRLAPYRLASGREEFRSTCAFARENFIDERFPICHTIQPRAPEQTRGI